MNTENKNFQLNPETVEKVNPLILGFIHIKYENRRLDTTQASTKLRTLTQAFILAHQSTSDITDKQFQVLTPYRRACESAASKLTKAESNLNAMKQEISRERDFSTSGKWRHVEQRIRVIWGNPDFHPPFFLRWLKKIGRTNHLYLASYRNEYLHAQEQVRLIEETLARLTEESQRFWAPALDRAQESVRSTQNRLVGFWEDEAVSSLSSTIAYVRVLPFRSHEVALKYSKTHGHESAELRFFPEFSRILKTKIANSEVKRMLGESASTNQITDALYNRLPSATKHQWEEFLAEKLVKEWAEAGIIT